MSRIEIPASLINSIGSELKMDFHAIDVRLEDGRFFPKLVVRGGRYITGREGDMNGKGKLPFGTDDIAKVRPTARVLG
ncbi:MAG: hypothetical protein EOP24_40115 [Hyphomicrobiales bacterium]|nr:MAG: hypothetical protein EOP24_40115 [Hyphomicrobiales bacterium]